MAGIFERQTWDFRALRQGFEPQGWDFGFELGGDGEGVETVASALHGQRYPLPHPLIWFRVVVDGAAAPEGLMTYDSTQGNFLWVSALPSFHLSFRPSPPED